MKLRRTKPLQTYQVPEFNEPVDEPVEVVRDVDHKVTWRHRFSIVFVVALCMAGAFLISRIFLIHNSMRLDEAQSLWQTSHTFVGTLKVVAQDVHVPLYHIVLHFWQLLVGQSIQSARFISLIFFLATIPLVYLLARYVLSVGWSLFVTFLFSFSPFMNWYANEARMYTMLVFVATLSQLFFLRLVSSKGQKGWVGYSTTALVGIYTHYFFFFTLIVQGLYFLATRHKFVPGTFKRFLKLAGVLVVAFLPWLIFFIASGSASNTSPQLPKPSSVDFFNVFSQFAFGFQTDRVNTILVSMWPILVIVALLSVKYGQKVTPRLGYMGAAAIGPIVLAFVLSYLVTPFFLSRYMVACTAPMLIVVVWFISNYTKWFAKVAVLAVLAVLAGVSLQQYLSPDTPVKENYSGAAQQISSRATAQDIVVLSAPFTVYPFDYYYNGPAKVVTLPAWDRTVIGPIPPFSKKELPKQVASVNKDHQYVYLLLSYDQGYQNDIYQYYEQRFERVDKQQLSSDLELVVYRVGYSQTPALGKSYTKL